MNFAMKSHMLKKLHLRYLSLSGVVVLSSLTLNSTLCKFDTI